MARETVSVIGSGTLVATRKILPESQRGSQTGGRGELCGSNVTVINPEDLIAVDTFASSGLTLGTSVIEIGPYNNPLPRARKIRIQNDGAQDAYISHKSSFVTLDSYLLPARDTGTAPREVEIELLHNVSIYMRTGTGSTTIRLLFI